MPTQKGSEPRQLHAMSFFFLISRRSTLGWHIRHGGPDSEHITDSDKGHACKYSCRLKVSPEKRKLHSKKLVFSGLTYERHEYISLPLHLDFDVLMKSVVIISAYPQILAPINSVIQAYNVLTNFCLGDPRHALEHNWLHCLTSRKIDRYSHSLVTDSFG